jgi:alkanesulfonate monooxygenase SsuD/methylene tetrahydromethanopterin reductase-like flavin-dependent oxidoreductase (luciferase family)
MGRGFGVAAAVDNAVIKEVAAAAETRGYSSFWVNDTPGADGLDALAVAAEVTQNIKLGVGVISVDRRSPASIAADVERLGLPQERLWLGIGSGVPKGALARVHNSVEELHGALSAQVIVAALGPKMCDLAGSTADGVLFNWLLPDYAVHSCERVEAAAEQAGRPRPLIMGYVRAGLLPQARERIESEAGRYSDNPNYARHFERQGVSAVDTVLAERERGAIQARVKLYEAALDETIVRALTPDDNAPTILALLEAAAPPRG